MNNIEHSQPQIGRIVWCFRKYKGKREVRLAIRNSTKPYTFSEDAGANAWWNGLNDDSGKSWSDSTVEGWDELEVPNATQTMSDRMNT